MIGRAMTALVLAWIVGMPVSARAQGPQPTPAGAAPRAHDVSVFFGAGAAEEFGDASVSPATWAAGVRYGLRPHLALELEAGRWTSEQVYDYIADWTWKVLPTSPTHRVLVQSSYQWHVALSAVVRPAPRRVSWSAGLGLALLTQGGRSTDELTRLADQRHETSSYDWKDTGVGALGTAGVDVRILRQLYVFAQFRVTLGLGFDTALVGGHAGLRVAF